MNAVVEGTCSLNHVIKYISSTTRIRRRQRNSLDREEGTLLT